MSLARMESLENKHQKLEKSIDKEESYPARNQNLIDKLKKEKLQLKQEITRLKLVDA